MQTRRASTRLPDKVFLPLMGAPLFIRQAKRILASTLCGRLVIATTTEPIDDRICEACEEEGLHVFRGHPNDLLDRHYQAAKKYEADIVIKIPSDCPLIDPVVIDHVIQYYLDHPDRFDYVSNLHPASFPDGNDVEVMRFTALEEAWKKAERPFEREHTTPYLWERIDQFRIGNVAMEDGADYSMTHRFTIDYPEDYKFINTVYEELFPADPLFGVGEIIDLLEKKPAIYSINSKLAGVNWYRDHLQDLKTIDASRTKIIYDES